jgi:hypothetical protein
LIINGSLRLMNLAIFDGIYERYAGGYPLDVPFVVFAPVAW